ncbi:fibrocystin-L-like [Amphiura filiformis]|uniref:fibrocystin-L-like n=1 Tax=Amphiura filiformis TaxID=82378 RepID=UPI003B217338
MVLLLVLVNQYGTCAGYAWDVEWASKGGNQPLIKVNEAGLVGLDVSASVIEITEGRLFQGPIPGEYLRTPHLVSQVEVMVNSIPSICAGYCTFSYDLESTPHVTSVSPISGSQYHGTVITISGSGFSDVLHENVVTIGGAVCEVVGAADSIIECAVGQGPMGEYPVLISVNGKGLASYPDVDVVGAADSIIECAVGQGPMGEYPVLISVNGQGLASYPDVDVVGAADSIIECAVGQGPMGEYPVLISVNGKGLASYPDGDVMFSYESEIIDVEPPEGSAVGGTQLTISGHGFPCITDEDNNSEEVSVTVGTKSCRVLSMCYDEIICKITMESNPSRRRKRATTVDVKVTTKKADIVKSNAFTYDESLTATVSSISPTTSSVLGKWVEQHQKILYNKAFIYMYGARNCGFKLRWWLVHPHVKIELA